MHIMLAVCATLLSLATASMDAAESHPPRLELAADSGWKFLLGDPSGAESPSFADTTWRNVDLPMTGVSKAGQTVTIRRARVAASSQPVSAGIGRPLALLPAGGKSG
jgi:hypothetical protein